MPPLDPLGMLVSLSGVGLVVFLVWLATRRAAPVVLGGEAGLRAWLARELLAFEVGQVAVDVDDQRAVVTSADGREVVLVFPMGRRPIFWRLPITKIGHVLREGAGGQAALEVRTGDFTRPRLSFSFSNKAQIPSPLLDTQGPT